MSKRIGSKDYPVVFVPEPWHWHYIARVVDRTVEGWKRSRYDTAEDVIARDLSPEGLDVVWIECEGISPTYVKALEQGRAVTWNRDADCYTLNGELWAYGEHPQEGTLDLLFQRAMDRLNGVTQ